MTQQRSSPTGVSRSWTAPGSQRDRGVPPLRDLPHDLGPLGRPRQRSGLAALLAKDRRPPVMPTATPPTRSRRCSPRRSPGRPWAPASWSATSPIVGAPVAVGSTSSWVATGSAVGPSGSLPWPSRPRHHRDRDHGATDGPSGFCHFAARPGDLVALDTFSVGKPEGIGPVWQLTAVDPATRHGIGTLAAGDKSARDAAGFVDHVAERLDGIGVELGRVLTDNGPECTGPAFTSHLGGRNIGHRRIPPRSPNHNAVGERFQGTAPQEFYRPAFHRQHSARLADLGAQFQGWQHDNTRRRHHGDFLHGRTPFAVMEAHLS
jgi:transposase InsO family protein